MRGNFLTYDLAVRFYRAGQKVQMPAYLKSQFDRASSSIVLNTNEGSGRKTLADRRRFFSIGLGSLRECQAILDLVSANGETRAIADSLGGCLWRLCYGKS